MLLSSDPTPKVDRTRLGVFGDNRLRPIHQWYPFIEGYSAELVERAVQAQEHATAVLDPFGGCGTTALALSERGGNSWFTEVNPFLAWVADVKVNRAREAAADTHLSRLLELANELEHGCVLPPPERDHPLLEADAKREFFPAGVAAQVVALLRRVEADLTDSVLELARLAVLTSLVPASNMIRRTDLRRRTPRDPAPEPVAALVAHKMRMIVNDVIYSRGKLAGGATHIGNDARTLPVTSKPVELVVTSPPYLNGTNYSRNTKLELLAGNFIRSESDLAKLRTEAITAGINYVSKRRQPPTAIETVERIAAELDLVAYDKRIPALVRGYFSDMRAVFFAIRRTAAPNCEIYLDIGDSRFAGVHVPTDELLTAVADEAGWRHVDTEHLRSRRSYDGSALKQVLIHLRAAT